MGDRGGLGGLVVGMGWSMGGGLGGAEHGGAWRAKGERGRNGCESGYGVGRWQERDRKCDGENGDDDDDDTYTHIIIIIIRNQTS